MTRRAIEIDDGHGGFNWRKTLAIFRRRQEARAQYQDVRKVEIKVTFCIAPRKCWPARNMEEDDEPACMILGQCEAAPGERGITNCIHCGKELHERDHQWWTHDADDYEHPMPQCYVT